MNTIQGKSEEFASIPVSSKKIACSFLIHFDICRKNPFLMLFQDTIVI